MVRGDFDSLTDWRVNHPASFAFTGLAAEMPRVFVIANDKLMPLAATGGAAAAAFDPSGKRVFVASAEDATLRVFDPAASDPQRSLLAIPIAGAFSPAFGWIGLEVSPTSSQLVVALDDTLTFFDVPVPR
jgi:hypothetical protein